MASRHDIIHIDFEANAGKVSPALKAIQNSATDTRKAVEGAKQALADLEKAGAGKTVIEAQRKKVNELERDVKSLEQAGREYVKGIGTLDKAIKAFNNGTLEQMSAAFQKASYNAAKLAQTKLVPSDKDYKKSMEELSALMQRNMENMAKARMQTDDLLKAIEGGGKVSASWIRTEKQNLEELLDVIPRGTTEWKEYNDQLTKIKDHVQTLSETERRLAGEIVNADDARRMANQLTKEGADAAKREREAAEATIAAQDKKIEKLEQERQKHLENAQAISKQIAEEANDIELKQQAIAKLEKQVAAENTASANKKQSAEAQKVAEEAQAAATAKITEAETLYNQKLETRIQKEKELKEIQGRGISDDPHLKQLQEEIAKLEELIAVSDKYKKQFTKMSDAAFEKGYMGKTGPTDDERKSVWRAEEYLKRAYHDRLKASVADHPSVAGDPQYQEAAKRVAGGIVQNAQENLRRAIYAEIKDGGLTSSAIENRLKGYRNQMAIAAHDATGSLKDDPEYNAYKYIIAQMEKYLEVARQVEAERAKIAGSSPFTELAREKDVLSDEPREGLIRQKEKRIFEEATGGSDAINRRKEEERVATEALTKAQDEERQALARLDEEKKKSAEQTQTATQATKQSTEATSEAAKQLATAKAELEGMEATHEKHIGELQKENQAIQQQDDLIKQEADTMQEAEVKKAQNQELTVKRMEEIVAMLEKQNHDTIPANTKKWQENQQEIDRLNEKIKEAKNEWMSYADAEKFAESIGTDGFIATSDQLQKATQSLTRYRDTLIKTIQQKREDGAATAEEEAELKKVEAELKKMKFEMDNANMSSKRMHEILKDPSSAKNLDELSAAIKRSTQELKLMEETIGKDNAKYKEMAEQTKNATIAQKEMEAQFKASASSFEKAWSRLKTYISLYVGAAVAMQKIVATMGDLMELSDKMGEVRKTTGFTADEVGRLSTALANMDTRTSLTGLMELSAVAGQLGLKTEQDVQGFTEAANMLMVALPEMGKEGATAMLKVALATGEIEKIRQQMQDGLIEGSDAVSVAMTKIGSTIDSLRANSAAAAPAITDFVKRVGAVGAQSGITIDQVAALGSTVDALGMRVEMSATALSRMIPAIRNNAFEIGKTIGLSQERIEEMYKEGRAMEVIIMLLEKMRGMTAEDIEGALSTGGMADVLKDLNQQGARAGIVFAGLSQNVDELKRQLGVAKTAYEENIAIQNEYNKMNETTAAKWARLKNTIEEMFVGNTSQSRLGTIIDGLRWIVDLLAGKLSPALNAVGVALKAILVSVVATKLGFGAAFKAMWDWVTNLRTNVVRLTESLKAFYAANKANIWMAIAMAIYYVGQKIYDTMTAVSELDQELARMDNEMQAAEKHLNNLVNQFTVAAKKSEEAAKKHQELEERTKALREEVEKLRKSTDGSAEATETLKRKEDELKESEKQLKQATDESNKANDDRLKLIAEINTKYSTYLGYMLSEKTAAEQVASAHQLIVAALKEELKQKGLVRKQEAVDEKYEKDIKEYSEDALDELSALPRQVQQRVRDAWNTVQASITSNIDDNGRQSFGLSKIEGIVHSGKTFGKESDLLNYMKGALKEIVLREVPTQQYQGGTYVKLGKNLVGIQQYLDNIWGSRIDDGFGDWAETVIKKEAEREQVRHDSQVESNAAHQVTIRAAFKDINGNMDAITKTINNNNEFTDEQIRQLAQNVNAIVTDTQKYRNDFGSYHIDAIYGEGKEETLENAVDTLLSNVGEKVRKQVLAVARQAIKKSVDAITPNPKNPYGNAPAADSTEYSTWNVEELVFRRKQMDKYKNVLKPGVEVREVLSQDKALMKALDNGLKDDWQSVLNWYNQERLKIQKELKSERFSTNEGHWLDEKNKGHKNKQPESDYALAELDRYYLRRKQAMEKARSEEKITEEMYNRQVELLEQEHLKKRSDLRGTFTGELGKKETEQFRKWWKGLEKQYELDDVSWKTVESEWSKATAAQIGRNNQRMQKDLTDQQAIVMKHMNTIAGIIAQERPYDGITKNLQDNLTKIDVLFADFGVIPNEQIENGSLFEENSKRLAFLLGEAERAYTLTAEELTADMRKAGFDAWADALDEQAKQRLLAQLQSTYDKIQEAIKKEAAQIKKEVDIWWSDIATGEKQSRKDTFEKALSNLGLWEDGVKRANSLIGAGVASERVADKLAIKQMQIRLAMQATYFAKMREVGELEIRRLQEAGKLQDAEHLRKSLNLALTQEQVKLDEQRVAIANKLEESQNRLYTQMHEYADLLYSSMQSLFEASNTGNAEFYNERAKLQLTGGDGTAKQYIVIDNAGTEDAEAHYEYLTEMEALERQHEIDQQNASAEAWRKVMDDVNAKINEMITDQLNAMLQDAAINDNTAATNANTEALIALTNSIGGGKDGDMPGIDTTFGSGLNLGDIMSGSGNGSGSDKDKKLTPSIEIGPLNRLDYDDYDTPSQGSEGNNPSYLYDWSGNSGSDWASWRIEQNNAYTENAIENAGKRQEAETKADKKMAATAQSAFAKMTQAANLYGIAYQVMSNDNMTAAQKFGMIAVQAAGNAAITALTVNMSETAAQTASDTPSVFSKLWKQLGWGAIPVFALFTGLLGGLMGLAASAITKSKSQIAQATGVSASQGRLATGMLTYAEGNVNEFTDPGSLTPGRHYNVDAADGKSYRAKYMGTNPKTHITNGPEFHLAGEAGREAIIDAHTTRLLQMDDNGIWSAIQTLYNGGSLRHCSRRGRGVRAFASGNLEEFEAMDNEQGTMDNGMDIAAMTDALNRQTAVQEALLERLSSPIQATFNVYGKGGLVDSYDTGKKTVNRHGVKY